MYEEFGISEKIEKLAEEAEQALKKEFEKIDLACTKNSLKVLRSFSKI